MDNFIGRQIDTYRIDALLGEGGMGAVYRGYDLNLKRRVAIKLMHSQLASQPEFRQRFLQEAQVAARLGEQNASIIKIYYLGANQDPMYMVQAYVPGGSLADHVRSLQKTGEAVQLREILILMAQVAGALGYAHRQGVIHRDIKPSNVLLQRLEEPDQAGDPPLRAIVTDFGLAKLLEGGVQTRSGSMLGTFAYMSPEQTLRKDLDGRSDIYSLGVMLYQLTTGRLPLDIQTITDAILKHQQNEMPPAPREIWSGVPEYIEAIIQKAINKRPEDRFQDAETMEQALRAAARRITEADVTQFTGQRNVLSLETRLQQSEPIAEPSRMGFDLSPIPSKDRLVIAQKDRTPRSIPLDKVRLTIGRSAENDLVLEHPDISRQHARLERTTTGWQVTDLKSTNGTYLDGNPLLAGVAEPFQTGKTLRIGPYFLHWQGAESSAADARRYSRAGAGSSVPLNATHLQSRAGQISVTLQPTSVELMPGNQVVIQIELFNQGTLVDHFKLRVLDLPLAWVMIPQPVVDLMPGTSSTAVIQILPPHDNSARANSYPYRVIVESQAIPGENVTVSGQLIIKPSESFAAELHPTRLSHGSSSSVSIRNNGNTEGVYNLIGRDPADEILFSGEKARIRIPPFEERFSPITVKPKKRPIIGRARSLPFEIQVSTSKGDKKGLSGQLVVQPLLPPWVLPLAGILMVLCLGIGGLGLNVWNNERIKATQLAQWVAGRATAQLNATQTAIAVNVAKTSTQESIQNQESQGTRVAERATAQFNATQIAVAVNIAKTSTQESIQTQESQGTQVAERATAQFNAAQAEFAALTATAQTAHFSDPFSYCAAVGTIDIPDKRYSGPTNPDAIAQLLKNANAGDLAWESLISENGVSWRCMAGKVYACTLQGQLVCDSKANTDKSPTSTEWSYCKDSPNSDLIPEAALGANTIYDWRCNQGTPVIDKQIFHVDAQGYIQEIWYQISPP